MLIEMDDEHGHRPRVAASAASAAAGGGQGFHNLPHRQHKLAGVIATRGYAPAASSSSSSTLRATAGGQTTTTTTTTTRRVVHEVDVLLRPLASNLSGVIPCEVLDPTVIAAGSNPLIA